jgi:WhiB family redox-sensing transcriptional regulator
MTKFQLADGVRDASSGPSGPPRAGRRDAAAEDWRVIAACQSVDPELFFPISAAGKGLEEVAEAKRVCARCLVQAECLAFAQRTGQVHGIWGGLTEEERIRVRRSRRREPAAAATAWQPGSRRYELTGRAATADEAGSWPTALRSGHVPDVTLAQHLLQPGDLNDPAGTR